VALQAVAFDLDDTLTDWSAAIDRALVEVTDASTAARFRKAIEEHAWLRRDGTVVTRRHWMTLNDPLRFWRSAVVDGEDVEELAALYRDALRWPLFDDVLPTLDALAARVRLALLSNSPNALERAAAAGVLDLFEVALSAPPDRMKPHPDAFDALLDALALPAAAVAFVGDDAVEDVEGALAHGMPTVWLDRHRSGWHTPPGVITVHSLTDVPAALGL
jgi:putative hydrolase of the HAD superfamily